MEVLNGAALHEPAPIPNGHPHVADMVQCDVLTLLGSSQIAHDIAERKKAGMAKYGTALQPHNGRNAAMDCYQELLDAANYMRQQMYEGAGAKEFRYEHKIWLTKYQTLLELIKFMQYQLPSNY